MCVVLQFRIQWFVVALCLLLSAGCHQDASISQTENERQGDQSRKESTPEGNLEGEDLVSPRSSTIKTSTPKYSVSNFDLADDEFYSPVQSERDLGGLMVAGSNSSSVISECKSINGLSVDEIETLMRPNNPDKRSAASGFLTVDQRLIDVLVEDNDYVTKLGLSHRELAIPLLQISNRAVSERNKTNAELIDQGRFKELVDTVDFKHAGTNWRVKVVEHKGFQYSPFNDDTETKFDFVITNLDNEQTVKFSGLVPIMIERYGFYEGKGIPYRVEPARIIAALGLNIEN